MGEILSKVDSEGRTTIPAEMREVLNLKDGDAVTWIVDGSAVKLLRLSPSVAERIENILRSNKPPLTAEEERELIERLIAEEAVRQGMD